MPTLERLNQWTPDERREALSRCCGAHRWVEGMMQQFPITSSAQLFQAADRIWNRLTPDDWLEAFRHHPKIGDIDSLRQKFQSTQHWAKGEQQGVEQASEETLQRLAQGNAQYEARFGFIFIVCATGKTADEMLALLEQRLTNEPKIELQIAAREQLKITHIRLKKLLEEGL